MWPNVGLKIGFGADGDARGAAEQNDLADVREGVGDRTLGELFDRNYYLGIGCEKSVELFGGALGLNDPCRFEAGFSREPS